MQTLAGAKFDTETVSCWAARAIDRPSYLRELELAPCTSEEPDRCLLRGTYELPWGASPEAAIATLLDGVEPSAWPRQVGVRLFDFSGPVVELDDCASEESLLSPESPSPLWPELRDSAAARRVGLIRLKQLRRLIVPVLALRKSGAKLEWAPRSRESVLQPQLALAAPDSGAW